MFLSYSPRYISVLHYSLLKPPTQIYPPNKYIPLTSSLSFTNKSFRRIPWASWHQIYQCPFISRNSSILSSWCLRLITLPVFWIPPLPVSQALLLLLYFQLLPLQLRIGKSMSLPSNKQKQPKSLPDPVLATSYCPPRSPFPLPVFTYSVQLLPPHQFPTTHRGLGSPSTTSLKLSSIFISKCCHQIPGALFSCHHTMSLCSAGEQHWVPSWLLQVLSLLRKLSA